MQRRSRWRIGESIPPPSRAILQRLGVWDHFLAQGHLPSAGSCASWGAPVLGYNDFILDMQGKGWHLDRTDFDEMLSAAVVRHGITVARDLRLCEVKRNDDGYLLSFQDNSGERVHITTGFMVDATGVIAGAVRRLGVARNQTDCLAVIFSVFALECPNAVPSQALLEACEYGWWYAAKLPKKRIMIALAVDPSGHHRFSDAGTWLHGLHATRHVAEWLQRGRAAIASSPTLETALAPSVILSRVVGEHWLAVGDAASAYDPIAAQGIVKALRDGDSAADAISGFLTGAGESPLLVYQDNVFARFRDYLRVRRHLYTLERRWPHSPFWQRRLHCQ